MSIPLSAAERAALRARHTPPAPQKCPTCGRLCDVPFCREGMTELRCPQGHGGFRYEMDERVLRLLDERDTLAAKESEPDGS